MKVGLPVKGLSEELTETGRIPRESVAPQNHFVQLYGCDKFSLSRNVARFFAEGFRKGDGLALIAGVENTSAILSELTTLGLDPDSIRGAGRLTVLDAEKTLRLFMHEGQPESRAFFEIMAPIVQKVRSQSPSGEMSAYGEMVGVLWTLGCFSGAMALEDMWNEVLASGSSSLFCAYPIDIFGDKFHACDIEALLCSHHHMIPVDGNQRLENAISRAIDEVMPERARSVRARVEAETQAAWAKNLKAEAIILWLRKNLCDQADEILDRARQYYFPEKPIDQPARH